MRTLALARACMLRDGLSGGMMAGRRLVALALETKPSPTVTVARERAAAVRMQRRSTSDPLNPNYSAQVGQSLHLIAGSLL